MADWFSKRMEALKTRASNMALTDWLAVGAVVAVGTFYYWRRSTRAQFDRMLASWVCTCAYDTVPAHFDGAW